MLIIKFLIIIINVINGKNKKELIVFVLGNSLY